MAEPTVKKKRAPRQLSEAREKVLLDVARKAFLERGLEAVSMDEIARISGVSKATIYRRYPSKDEMFSSIVLDSIKELTEAFEHLALDEDRPTASLRKAAQGIHRFAGGTEAVNLLRQLITEASRKPELSRGVRNLIIANSTDKFTAFFERLIAKGLMRHSYPQQAATTFFILCTGSYRPLLNALGPPEDERRRMEADLQMFIDGCHIRDP